MPKPWDTLFDKKGRIAIVPKDDVKPHINFSPACPCQPKIIVENRSLLIIHNSWDGREYYEKDNPKYGQIN